MSSIWLLIADARVYKRLGQRKRLIHDDFISNKPKTK